MPHSIFHLSKSIHRSGFRYNHMEYFSHHQRYYEDEDFCFWSSWFMPAYRYCFMRGIMLNISPSLLSCNQQSINRDKNAILEHPPICKFSIFGITDLHVLLRLTKDNMKDHKIFKTCLHARRNADNMNEVCWKSRATKNRHILQPYLKVLFTITAWGTTDPSDEKAEAILHNFK